MSLNLNTLTEGIKTAIRNQIPDGEDLSEDSIRFATDLAVAIHDYVRVADVTGVSVDAGESITYHQTGKGDLE